MRAALLLVFAGVVALSGCGKTDPCSGKSGSCVTVNITSSQIARVDDLELSASGIVVGDRASVRAAESLPIKLAVQLPASVSGTLSLVITGKLSGTIEGVGQGSVEVPASGRAELDVDLEPSNIISPMDDLADAAMDDMTGIPPADMTVLFTPTAPVVNGDFDDSGLGDFMLPAGVTLLNSDTGLITNGATTLRNANAVFATKSIDHMIAFHTVSGVGVFSFHSLTVPVGATIKVVGTLPPALVSTTSAVINGVITVQAMDANGNVCVYGAVTAGAGTGGTAGITGEPNPTNGGVGGGMGGGTGGIGIGQGGPSSSGGGGGHGAVGGTGAQPSSGPVGGPGGPKYDTVALSPYHGGSGGGGGAAVGATGGSGGGAIQLVAAQVVTIGAGNMPGGINAGGCGGQMVSATAGGGGSGGAILIESPTVQLSAKAVLAANGGGGAAYDGGNVAHNGANASFDDQPALGGGDAVGQPAIFGGNGGAGDVAAGGVANAGMGQYAGGGATGIIRINASGAPSVTAGAILSPSRNTTVCTFGPLN